MKKLSLRLVQLLIAFVFFSIELSAQSTAKSPPMSQALNISFIPGSDARSLETAKLHFLHFEYEQALYELDNVIADDPKHAQAFLFRGYLRGLLGRKSEAAQDFQRANTINPYISEVYGYEGNGEQLKTLAFDPWQTLAELPSEKRLNYYLNYLDMKYSDRASDPEISEARQERYDNEWRIMAKVIQFSEEKNYKRAGELLDNLLVDYPDSPLAWDMKGLILFKTGAYEESKSFFEKAIQLDPSFAIAWYNLSAAERKSDQPEKALENLNTALSLSDNLTKAYFDRALVRKQLGDEKGALEDYEKVIEKTGDDYLEAFLNRGLTLKMLGDFEKALPDINFVIQNSEPDPFLYKNRGNIYQLIGQPERGIEDYTKAIELDQNFAEAYFNRGIAYLITGNNPKGCKDFEKSLRLGYKPAGEKSRYFCK